MEDKEEDSNEPMIRIVRELVKRELEILKDMKVLGEDGLDRLAKIALILQRTRPAYNPAGGYSDRALMRKAGEDE